MGHETDVWPYGPTLARLALASAIGLFIGIERERRRKEAGLRTFAFAALLGCAGGLLGDSFSLLALALIGVLVILLNVETIHTGEGAEITTSAALMITGFAGVLAGRGHTFTPTVLGVATAALLAWKKPLAGFSVALTESEFRSAILLAIVAFVVYPVLPTGSVDPWHLVEPRTAWITVILIAALGFTNYVLLKLYGTRGVELTGFLGGLVNSTVTVAELAQRVSESGGALAGVAFKGVMLSTAAMLIRNAVIVALVAPSMVVQTAVPMALMLIAAAGAAWLVAPGPSARLGAHEASDARPPIPALASPFSLTAAIKFGLVFLALQVGGTLGQRMLGDGGFLTVSVIGGVVSSASAVASAATLASAGTVPPHIAATGVIIASATSALADWPIVARVGRHPELTRRVRQVLLAIVALGCAGAVLQQFIHGQALALPPGRAGFGALPGEQVGIVGEEAVHLILVDVPPHGLGERRPPLGRRVGAAHAERVRDDREPGRVRIGHEPGPCLDEPARRSDARGECAQLGQPLGRQPPRRHVVGTDEEGARHLGQQLGEPPDALLLEHLELNGRPPVHRRSGEAVAADHVGHQALRVEACRAEAARELELRENTRPSVDDVDGFLEGQHPLAGKLRVEPRPRVELLDLLQREVLDEPPPRRAVRCRDVTVAVREQLAHVGRALERGVVRAHQDAVLRDAEILLHVLGALLDGQPVRGGRVLGGIRRRAPMRDDERARRRRLRARRVVGGAAAACLQQQHRQQCRQAVCERHREGRSSEWHPIPIGGVSP